MKNIYKNIGLFALLLFSFFYTEKIAIIMQNKSPLMKEIESVSSSLEEKPVNAVVDGDYIKPGVSGKSVNKVKSFVNMKSFGVFDEYYLIFDNIKPDISIDNNKDKIIKSGNREKNSVALLLEYEKNKLDYLQSKDINISVLITEEEYKLTTNFEQINNDVDNYRNIESLLNKNNKNTNICYIKNMDIEKCKKEKKYLVEETYSLNSSNIIDAKKNIENGAIILIKKETPLKYLELFLNEIKFKGLNVTSVSNLITEKK